MKIHSSSNNDTSTFPTLLDHSLANHDQKMIARPQFHSLLLKIRELESTLIQQDHQKMSLIEHQQKLKRVLQEKLRIVNNLLNTKDEECDQQSHEQYQETHQNWRVNHMNHGIQRQSQFKHQKTHRRFYSALNSRKAQPLDQTNTLTNSRVESQMYAGEEVDQLSAFRFRESGSPEAKTIQKWYKTSNIIKQNVESYLNKYETIEDIWNGPVRKGKIVRHSQLRKTYL